MPYSRDIDYGDSLLNVLIYSILLAWRDYPGSLFPATPTMSPNVETGAAKSSLMEDVTEHSRAFGNQKQRADPIGQRTMGNEQWIEKSGETDRQGTKTSKAWTQEKGLQR